LQQNDKAVLVYVTYPGVEAAEQTGAALVDMGLAACVNILPGMVSIYVWEGARQRDAEAVMIVKTRATLADRVVAETLRRHSYETPAVLVLPVEGGSPRYLDWIFGQTANPAPVDPSDPSVSG
jgi:periplasmic divalent cation tolerance protein